MLLKILPKTSDAVDHHVCSIIGVGPIGDKLAADGIPVHYLDLSHTLDLSIVPKLKKLIKELRPDVLITYLPHADLLGRIIGRAAGVPTIVGSVRVRLIKSKYWPYFIIDGLTSGLVDHYHFNSRTIAEIHHRYLGVSRKKMTIIPNAINVDQYDIKVDVSAKKRALGLAPDKFIIGCVARLRRQKGHPILLSAFSQVVKSRPHTQLVLVGDGEEKKNLLKHIEVLKLSNDVVMLGNRHDVPEILQTFDIFAFTTLYEGMSNSIMEAMAARRAIVTTDIPENRELLQHGVTGLLTPSHDVEETARALIELIDDEKKRIALAKKANEEIRKNFNIDRIVPRYREFYLSL